MRRRTQGDESEPLLSSMEQTPPTKEKLDATSDDAVIIPVDDEDADLDTPDDVHREPLPARASHGGARARRI